MKLSVKATKLLKAVYTEEASKPLTRSSAKPAQELVDTGLAVLIPKSQGGADVCLTNQGIRLAEFDTV